MVLGSCVRGRARIRQLRVGAAHRGNLDTKTSRRRGGPAGAAHHTPPERGGCIQHRGVPGGGIHVNTPPRQQSGDQGGAGAQAGIP